MITCKNMRKLLLKMFFTAFFFLLAACGGGGGSSDNSQTTTVAGYVEDPAISGALVWLKDTEGSPGICGHDGSSVFGPVTTDAHGYFSMTLDKAVDPERIMIVTLGGMDKYTGTDGIDFKNITLNAPLSLFAKSGNSFETVVSPMTTLVALETGNTGGDIDSALENVAARFPAVSPEDLKKRPSVTGGMLAAWVSKLSISAAELVKGGSVTDSPFKRIYFAADGGLHEETEKLLTADASQSIREQFTIIDNALLSNTDLPSAFAAKRISEEITRIIKYQDDPGFDETDPVFQDNVYTLSSLCVDTAKKEGTLIPVNGIVPQRLARHLIISYGLSHFSRYTGDDFGSLISGVSDDPMITEIAKNSASANYDVSQPLIESEIPGNDNRERIDYYFSSDASHLFNAERLLNSVLDDEINDSIMVEVATGNAVSGFWKETETIIESEIYGSHAKGDAYVIYARILAEYGDKADAVKNAAKAETLFKKVLESKGRENIELSDIENFSRLSVTYSKAGALTASGNILDYLGRIADEGFLTTDSQYALMVNGIYNYAKNGTQNGEISSDDELRRLADFMYTHAAETPLGNYKGQPNYWQKVLALKNCATVYAMLGDGDRTGEIYETIQTIRNGTDPDGIGEFTKEKTWSSMPALATALVDTGRIEEARALAGTIPEKKKSYKLKILKRLATWEALTANLASALGYIDANIVETRDKIEALTYWALNRDTGYIAQELIEAGETEKAEAALLKAEEYADATVEETENDIYQYKVKRGYVKIADLHADTGYSAHDNVIRVLSKAERTVRLFITGVVPIAKSYADIAGVYYRINCIDDAERCLESAEIIADRITEPTGDITGEPFAIIINAYIEGGDNAAARLLIPKLVSRAEAVTPDTEAGEIDRAKYFMKTGEFYAAVNDRPNAVTMFMTAVEAARRINTEKYRDRYLGEIVTAYAENNFFSEAENLALSFATLDKRNEALESIAEVYGNMDRFPDTNAASVDTDRDGKPDFWDPLSSEQERADSGLIIDEDCDDDGIEDTCDLRPLFADL